VKCPILLSNFKHIWSFSTQFRKSPQYQISNSTSRNGADAYGRKEQTDKNDEANKRFSLVMRMRLKRIAELGQSSRNATLVNIIRQAMNYNVKNETRSRNHCCRGKAISITSSERVFVASVTQHQSTCAHLYCHLWPVWLHHILSHYLKHVKISAKQLLNTKCVFLFSPQLLSETFRF
jgi:hypothetical protein